MVITVKVPPTRRALSMIDPIPGRITGRTRPTAITTCPRLHRRRLPSDLDSPAAANVDAAAVTPNTGHAHPNTDEERTGSPGALRAMGGWGPCRGPQFDRRAMSGPPITEARRAGYCRRTRARCRGRRG